MPSLKQNLRDIEIAPILDNWSDFNIDEKDSIEEITPLYNKAGHLKSNTIGVIVPVPPEIVIDEEIIEANYNFIKKNSVKAMQGVHADGGQDTLQGISIRAKELEGHPLLNPTLKDLCRFNQQVLIRAINTDKLKYLTTAVRVDTTHHSIPFQHSLTSVLGLKGQTTWLFRQNAEGRIDGKKQLPLNSSAAFTHLHAAPNEGDPRMNIVSSLYYL